MKNLKEDVKSNIEIEKLEEEDNITPIVNNPTNTDHEINKISFKQ